MLLVVIALCVTGAVSQVPSPCIEPLAMEGRVIELSPNRHSARISRFSYDANNERMSVRDEVIEGDTREFYEDLLLFREKTGYHVNLRTRHCERFALVEEFHRLRVPENATYLGAFYIGTSSVAGAGILVNYWTAETKGGHYSGSFTAKDCVPVGDTFVSSRSGLRQWNFFDTTLGIRDPNTFIPPRECA